MRLASAYLLIAFALPSAALADVTIQSRTSTVRGSFTTFQGPPLGNFADVVSTNQLGAVQLDTAHGEHFASTAFNHLISASMTGGSQSGGINSPMVWAHSTTFSVTFEVTQAPATMSMLITQGAVFPYYVGGQSSGTSLTIVNTTTGQVIFDLYSSLPPVYLGGPRDATWTNASWSTLLQQGTYQLLGDVQGGMGSYSAGGGSGSSSSGSLTFTAGFVPAPSATAMLCLATLLTSRRRR